VESGTTELSLPGLDVTPEHSPQPHGERGRWIERGPSGKLMLFSGRSHPVLAQKIADQLNIELGDVKLKTFANGETYCRYRSRSAAPTSSSSRRATAGRRMTTSGSSRS
jgi:hypothetical protein